MITSMDGWVNIWKNGHNDSSFSCPSSLVLQYWAVICFVLSAKDTKIVTSYWEGIGYCGDQQEHRILQ